MKPRLLTSKKWTILPKTYVSQIQEVFEEAFEEQLNAGKLIIEGRIYPEEILLRVGYLAEGRLVQSNFEVSMQYAATKENAIDRIHNCIDAAASLMNEYFESDGEVDFPNSWKSYDFDGKQIWVQHTTVNTELEAEADKLLGAADKSLVQEEIDNEDALARSEESLHDHRENDPDYFEDEDMSDEFDEEDDKKTQSEEPLPGPQIFSKKKKKKEDLH
jgi:hypothetical protein